MKWGRLGLQIIGAAALLALSVFGWMIYRDMSEHVGAVGKKRCVIRSQLGRNQNRSRNQSDWQLSLRRAASQGVIAILTAFRFQNFELADFAKDEWHDGPAANPILADALELAANDARRHASCFPTFDEANSSAMKISFTSVVVHDGQATAADIILYAPKTKMLYYVSFKT